MFDVKLSIRAGWRAQRNRHLVSQGFGHSVEEYLRLERLDEDPLDSNLRCDALDLGLEVMGCLQDDRRGGCPRISAHRASQLVTVDARRDQVDDDQVWPLLLDQAQSSASIS